MMQKSDLTVTSGAQWRKTRLEGVPIEFPSGNVARLRNVPVATLLIKGAFPDPLTPIILDILQGKQQKLDKTPLDKVAEATTALQKTMCCLAFVSPRIVDEPTAEDEIGIEDVADEDQQFIVNLLYASVERLAAEQFRQKQAAALSPVDEGETLPPTA